MRKIIIACSCYFFAVSCFTMPKKVSSNLYPDQPRRDQYHLSRTVFAFNPNIDTSAVYLHRQDDMVVSANKTISLYAFIRFSNDGTVYVSEDYEKQPGEEDFNNMVKGQFCLYKVRGQRVTIEKYDFLYKKFVYLEGEINDSALVLEKEWVRNNGITKEKLRQQQNFVKMSVKLTKPVIFP